MSRCFPFPPPGYEERVRPDEHLLKEEKRRDKKLKKEKKDKEKREGKDKRKREGDGRHKEKKHKKEKHKEKKDEEDKGNTRNDNEKSSISEDASIVRAPETRSAEEVHTGEVYFVEKGCGINKTKVDSLCQRQDEQESIDQSLDRDTVESKFFQKLGRIRDEAGATERTLGKSSSAYIIRNKFPRVTLYLPKDNGQIARHPLGLPDSDRKGIPPQDKVDIKNCEVSGTQDANKMPPSASATSCQLMQDSIRASPADKVVKASSVLPQASPLVAKVIKTSKRSKKHRQVDEFAEPSRKSPHPDMKHLSQLLLVPEKKEWPEVNNEDWLFSGEDHSFQNQKHVASASYDYGHQHVWSETVHMESADIYALPYVIPY